MTAKIASEATSSPLTITLFGPMQVLVEGRPLPHLRSRKSLWLLALLALRARRSVEREWLAGTLWPEVDQSRAAMNLRVVLSELRHALGTQGDRLQSPGRHSLSLDLAGADVDVAEFEAAAASRDQVDLARAVTLYRGPLLEGCNEEWAGQERAVREQGCLQALQTLAETAFVAGDFGAAAGYSRQAVGLDPWREAAQRGLMESLSQGGDGNAALDAYQIFVRLLRKDDPRAAPDAQTTALYARLRAQARHRATAPLPIIAANAPVPTVTGYLPHPLTDLVGREDERNEVVERLRRFRLVTLTGPGGIGKTRLAIAVAEEAAPDYADGVWLVALDALSEGAQVPAQIAGVLGVKEAPGRTLREGLTDHLRTKRLLLVLDNCEHLLEASAAITAHLLRECAELRVLTTSREALGITGEVAWGLPALPVPDLAHLPTGGATLVRVLGGYEGVRLFVDRAQGMQKRFALTRENALPVAQVCARLEGIPLAIELAAARVRSLTIEQIAARLDDHLALLTGGNRAAHSRQQTLRATLDWSYALLTVPEQVLLGRVSVFSGGWTLEAAEAVCSEAVCSEGGTGAGQVLDLLTSLVDKSLVVFSERGSPARGRYRLLETVRQYAAARLADSGQEEQVRARHRDWFLRVVEGADLLAATPVEEERSLRRLEEEHDNLRAALAWCEKDPQGGQAGLRLSSGLWQFWSGRSHYGEGRAFLQRALAREDAMGVTAARGQALKGAGALADRQSDYVPARTLYTQSLEIFREMGDRKETVSVLGSLNYLANRHGDAAAAKVFYAEAQAHYEQDLILFDGSGDRDALARTRHFLGHLAHNQGYYALARASHEQSLAIYREMGDQTGTALASSCAFAAAYEQGHTAEALVLQMESLRIYRSWGTKVGSPSHWGT